MNRSKSPARNLLDSFPKPVILLKNTGTILYLNSSAQHFFGKTEVQQNVSFEEFISHCGYTIDGILPWNEKTNSEKDPLVQIINSTGEYFLTDILLLEPTERNSDETYWIVELHDPFYEDDLTAYLIHNHFLFELLAKAQQEIFFVFDYASNSYTFLSSNVQEFLGYTVSEINSMSFQKIVKKIEKIGVSVKGSNQNKPTVSDSIRNEYLLLCKDGTLKWFEEKGLKLKNRNRKNIGTIGSLRNITHEKSLLLTLKETEHNLKSLLDFSPIGMAVIKDFQVEYANKELIRILEAETPEQIIGQSLRRFMIKDSIYIVQDFNEKIVRKKEKVYDYKGELLSLKNKKITVQLNAIPIQYQGQFAIQLIIRDISKQENEEKIRHTIGKILDAANTITDLNEFYSFIHSAVSELMPVKNFYISIIDEKTNQITFPYYVDEIEQDSVAEPIGLERKSLTNIVILEGKSLLIDKQRDADLRAEGKLELFGEPAEIWLGVPLKVHNKAIGAIVVQDYENPHTYSTLEQEILETIAFAISRLVERKIEEHEKATLIEQLKELNASKDTVFSLISHDLRSPFNSILGFLNILINEINDLKTEEILDLLHSLKRVSNNVLYMLNNLLEFSRFQRGRIEYQPTEIRLKDILHYVLDIMKGNIEKKQITLSCDIDQGYMVYADYNMLSSILQNLLGNAIKFSYPGKSIFISARISESFSDKEMLEISIKDEGVGMSEEKVSTLFQMDKIHSTYGTDNEVGTGLGLIIVRDFIKKHDGDIFVKSQPGIGSEFIFTLPFVKRK